MAIDIRQIKAVKYTADKRKAGITGNKFNEFFSRDIQLFKSGLNDKKKESFYSELAILLSSGIDIRTSLEIIVEEQAQPAMKAIFDNVYNKIIGGQSLSESLFQTGKFTLYEYYSLKIGEESGKIREVLNDLTVYYSKKIKQRRQLVSAFTYPTLVVITAFIAVFFMLKFIVPMFTEVFKRFQGELPPLTQMIINLSGSFSHYIGFIILMVILSLFLGFMLRNKSWYRKHTSQIFLKLPLFGQIINKIYLARYCQSMALLLGSKTPMLTSIQLVRKMIGFYPFEQALEIVENDVLHGKLLNQSMLQFNIFDKRILALTRVAEEVNQLDRIYVKLNAQYGEELEHQIGIIGNVLEPVMIIIVGVLVGIILISMYLPLFQLSTSII